MSGSDIYRNKLYILQESNCYKILGVEESDSIEVISREYRQLAKQLHPDMHLNLSTKEKTEISTIFKKITSAYDIIKDPSERRRYDTEIRLKRAKGEIPKKPDIKPKETPKETVKKTTKDQTELNPVIKTVSDFQKNSPIKNDPRLKATLTGFTFKEMKTNVDVEKMKAEKLERERKEKEAAELKFTKAKRLVQNKQYDEAITILHEIVEKQPKIAEYHSALGLAMQHKGWNGYAQAEFKVALHYDPNDEIAVRYYNKSTASSKKQNISDEKGVFGKLKSFFNKNENN